MLKTSAKSILRDIPATEALLQSGKALDLLTRFPRPMVLGAARDVLDALRSEIKTLGKTGLSGFSMPTIDALADKVAQELRRKSMPLFRRVINGTGIVLHTSLGRAVLAPQALEALNRHLAGYTRLAVDLQTGKRKSRDTIIEELICEITGAEAATVVNNNAAATVLILSTIARGKEVICSRGQMVEIGGSFRIPDIMETSGAQLVSVGTTNRTHLKDYAKAITKETGALLRVHSSNYRIIGFTSDVPLGDMVQLAHKKRLPVIDDLGSGALIDLSAYGLGEEPLVSNSVKAGADVICFSTDKLLGGPQGGIIIGKRKYIDVIRKNPLMRAFRLGKLNLVALEATLKLFRDADSLLRLHPVLRMLTADIAGIETRANDLKTKLLEAMPVLEATVIAEFSQPGSGSLAGYNIPTRAVAVRAKSIPPQQLAEQLRQREVPVFTRVKNNQVLLDLRTILPDEDTEIIKAFREIVTAV